MNDRNADRVARVPEMVPDDLEKLLKHLPEPNYVEVLLVGNFDYSNAFRETHDIVDGVELKAAKCLTCQLMNPSKEKILYIYRQGKEGFQKRIDFCEAHWRLKNDVEIKLTSYEVHIRYKGPEPAYISQMMQELAGTSSVRFNIVVLPK